MPRPPLPLTSQAVGGAQPVLSARQILQVFVPAVSHTGAPPPQSGLPRQPKHWPLPPLAVVSQMGVVALQPSSCRPAPAVSRQVLQTWFAASQTVVAPVQAVAFVAEHWTHAPAPLAAAVSQAGVAGVLSQPWSSARQVLQTCAVVSQTPVVQ